MAAGAGTSPAAPPAASTSTALASTPSAEAAASSAVARTVAWRCGRRDGPVSRRTVSTHPRIAASACLSWRRTVDGCNPRRSAISFWFSPSV